MAFWRSSGPELQRKFKDHGKKSATGRDTSTRSIKRLHLLFKILNHGDGSVLDFLFEQQSDIAFVIEATWGSCMPKQSEQSPKHVEIELIHVIVQTLKNLLDLVPSLFKSGWLSGVLDQLLGSILHPYSASKLRINGIQLATKWLSSLAASAEPSVNTKLALKHFCAARIDSINAENIESSYIGSRSESEAAEIHLHMIQAILEEMMSISEGKDDRFAMERFLFVHEYWITQYLSEFYSIAYECLIREEDSKSTPTERISSVNIEDLFAMSDPSIDTFNISARLSQVSTGSTSDARPSIDTVFAEVSEPSAETLSAEIAERCYTIIETWYIDFAMKDERRCRAIVTLWLQQTSMMPIFTTILRSVVSGSYKHGERDALGPSAERIEQVRRILALYNTWTSSAVVIQPSEIVLPGAAPTTPQGVSSEMLSPSSSVFKTPPPISSEDSTPSPSLPTDMDDSGCRTSSAQLSSVESSEQVPSSSEAGRSPLSPLFSDFPERTTTLPADRDTANSRMGGDDIASLAFEQVCAAHCMWLLGEYDLDLPGSHCLYFPTDAHFAALISAMCRLLSELFLPWWSASSDRLAPEEYTVLLDEAICIYQLILLQCSSKGNVAGLNVVIDSLLTSIAIFLSEMEMDHHDECRSQVLEKSNVVIQLRKLLTTTVMGWCRAALKMQGCNLDKSCSIIRPFMGKFARVIGEADDHALATWNKVMLDLTQAIVDKAPAAPRPKPSARDGRSLRREHSQLSPNNKNSPDSAWQRGSPRQTGRESTLSREHSRVSRFRSLLSRSPSLSSEHSTAAHASLPSRLGLASLLRKRDHSSTSETSDSGFPRSRVASVKTDFLDARGEMDRLDVDELQRIWVCAYSLPGDLNGMPPDMHTWCLRTLHDSYLLLGNSDPSSLQVIYNNCDPRRPIFLSELLATAKLGPSYGLSRREACQLLCRMISRRGIPSSFPLDVSQQIRSYILDVLNGDDITAVQMLIAGCPMLFSTGIDPDATLLVPCIQAAKSILFSPSTVEVVSDYGTLLSPKEAAITMLCSIATLVVDVDTSIIEEISNMPDPMQNPSQIVGEACILEDDNDEQVFGQSMKAAAFGVIASVLRRVAVELPEVSVRRLALDGLCSLGIALLTNPESSSESQVDVIIKECIIVLLAFSSHHGMGMTATKHIDVIADFFELQVVAGSAELVCEVLQANIRFLSSNTSRGDNGDDALVHLLFCLRKWAISSYVSESVRDSCIALVSELAMGFEHSPVVANVIAETINPVTPDAKARRQKNNESLPTSVRVVAEAIVEPTDNAFETPRLVHGRSPSLSRRRTTSNARKRAGRITTTEEVVERPSQYEKSNIVQIAGQVVNITLRCINKNICGPSPECFEMACGSERYRVVNESPEHDSAPLTRYYACNGCVVGLTYVGEECEMLLRSVAQRSLHAIHLSEISTAEVENSCYLSVADEAATGPVVSTNVLSRRQATITSLAIPRSATEQHSTVAKVEDRRRSAPPHPSGSFETDGDTNENATEGNKNKDIKSARGLRRELSIYPEVESSVKEADTPGLWSTIGRIVIEAGIVMNGQSAKFAPIPWSARLPVELDREFRDPRPVRDRHKIALIFVGAGQMDRKEIMSNTSGGHVFDDFAAKLGKVVEVGGCTQYIGGLSPTFDGSRAVSYEDLDVETVFQVSTWLTEKSSKTVITTGASGDATVQPQSSTIDAVTALGSKRWKHLGNNHVHIVWSENHGSFMIDQLPSSLGGATIAIHPLRKPSEEGAAGGDTASSPYAFWIQVLIKDNVHLKYVPGPLVHGAVVPPSALPTLVRVSAINLARSMRGEELKLHSLPPFFVQRADWLRDVIRLQDLGAVRPVILQKTTSLPTPPDVGICTAEGSTKNHVVVVSLTPDIPDVAPLGCDDLQEEEACMLNNIISSVGDDIDLDSVQVETYVAESEDSEPCVMIDPRRRIEFSESVGNQEEAPSEA